MKKLYILSLMLMCTVAGFAQTFFSENFGTPPTSSPYPAASAFTGYQNTTPIVYTGTADLRQSLPSTDAYTGASGQGLVFITGTVGRFFQVEGINTSTYPTADIQLSFGQQQNTSSTTPSTNLVLEVSTDGTNYTALPYTRTTNTGWELITITSGIPSTTNLRIRFTQASTIQYRIDDLKLTAVSSSCLLTLGSETKVCDASTLGTDTYSITLPYTGGGTATYGITASAGTIAGDSPSTVAGGNIMITGIPEGTAVTINITGGTCNLSREVTAISCKPINTLPFVDNFNYTAGTALGASQMWRNVNTGDDVTVIPGNLSYTGITPTGNSVSFSGTGAEAYAPFTATTSGAIYTSFLMNVTDMTNVTTDETQAYVLGLTEGTSTSTYNVRLYTKKVGTQYQLGLDTAGNTTTNLTTSSYNVGDVVFVILGFDYADNTYKAWINPTVSTFTPSATPTLTKSVTTAPVSFGGFIIRQDDANNTPSITIDELRIGTAVSDILSTKSFNEISGLKMFPNPLSGNVLNVTSNSSADKTIAVYDVLGKNVLNAKVTNETVNVSGLNSGVYIVKITEEGKTATRKLVVK